MAHRNQKVKMAVDGATTQAIAKLVGEIERAVARDDDDLGYDSLVERFSDELRDCEGRLRNEIKKAAKRKPDNSVPAWTRAFQEQTKIRIDGQGEKVDELGEKIDGLEELLLKGNGPDWAITLQQEIAGEFERAVAERVEKCAAEIIDGQQAIVARQRATEERLETLEAENQNLRTSLDSAREESRKGRTAIFEAVKVARDLLHGAIETERPPWMAALVSTIRVGTEEVARGVVLPGIEKVSDEASSARRECMERDQRGLRELTWLREEIIGQRNRFQTLDEHIEEIAPLWRKLFG